MTKILLESLGNDHATAQSTALQLQDYFEACAPFMGRHWLPTQYEVREYPGAGATFGGEGGHLVMLDTIPITEEKQEVVPPGQSMDVGHLVRQQLDRWQAELENAA